MLEQLTDEYRRVNNSTVTAKPSRQVCLNEGISSIRFIFCKMQAEQYFAMNTYKDFWPWYLVKANI